MLRFVRGLGSQRLSGGRSTASGIDHVSPYRRGALGCVLLTLPLLVVLLIDRVKALG